MTTLGDRRHRPSQQVFGNIIEIVPLVTNTHDFVLLGKDAAGNAAMPVRLSGWPIPHAEFEKRLSEHPRAFARDFGPKLGEYLSRALSHDLPTFPSQ